MTTKERIEKEALDAADSFDIRGCAAHQGYLRGYIAAAQETAALREQNERLKEAIQQFYRLMDKELQTEPINRARYMIRLDEIKNEVMKTLKS